MKITFFSNFFNHHQLYISQEFIKKGIDYTFVATEPIPEERLKLGYEDMNKKYNYVITTYDSKENYEKAMKLAVESDVVIIGSAPEIFIKERIKQNKLIMRYSERIFKKGLFRIKNLRALIYLLQNHTKYMNKNIYMLCASAYTAGDFALAGAYRNKYYRWGYFPEVKEYKLDELMSNKNNNSKTKLLWVGRFLEWKHPKKAIEIAKMLKDDKYDFEMTMIGTGEQEENIKQKIIEYDLIDNVKLLGAKPSAEVRKYMENSDIFLFTSDRNEGWGAVLNEAMNSACCVIASEYIGSVPFLIEDNVNGLIYKKNSNEDLYRKVKQVIDNKELIEKLGKNAYKTITEQWNPTKATSNFIQLVNNIQENKNDKIEEGPCSKAEIIIK